MLIKSINYFLLHAQIPRITKLTTGINNNKLVHPGNLIFSATTPNIQIVITTVTSPNGGIKANNNDNVHQLFF